MYRTIVHFTNFYIVFLWNMDPYRLNLKHCSFGLKIIFHLYRNLICYLYLQVTIILYENIFSKGTSPCSRYRRVQAPAYNGTFVGVAFL